MVLTPPAAPQHDPGPSCRFSVEVWQPSHLSGREDQTVCGDAQDNGSLKEDAGWVRGFFCESARQTRAALEGL